MVLKHGHIDILINCAGIAGKTNIQSHETETDNIRAVFDINFMGCYFTSQTCCYHNAETPLWEDSPHCKYRRQKAMPVCWPYSAPKQP
ncbi:MAG: SDR family NAD(P)-dependent oxidoreductase, partial [Saprospiraceae bacterium]|nr:SDR family NAD(P)-dependent oxidoreductase [Saprospiraceae bacterium]